MLKVFEAFAGVGAQRMALDNLGIEHEVVAISEIDKFAIASYEAIHGPTVNLGDISQLKPEDIPDHDLFTYSFPCQDISVAGKQSGLDMDSGTRSGLLWECQRVISAKKPKYLLLENVKNLVGKRHKANFALWLDWLEEQGYSNYWQVLNAKDYGIPQNRERVFVVSILGEHVPYIFPEKQELKLRLKDVLESEVDEKFYLDNPKTQKLLAQLDYAPTEEIKLNQVGNFEKLANPDKKFNDPQTGRVLDAMGICQALDTMQGGNRQPKVLIKNTTKKSSDTMGTVEFPVIAASRGRNPENPSDRTVGIPTEQRLEINNKGVSNTLTTVQKDNYVLEPLGTLAAHNSEKFGTGYMDSISKTLKANKHDISVVYNNFRIRKLTPLECWRLMGFKDLHFYKAQEVNSNSQLYKQAGNSIVVPVLEAIFKNMFAGGNR